MNCLEKLNALLTQTDRKIIYGKPTSTETYPLISLTIGESEKAKLGLEDKNGIYYESIEVNVYGEDYNASYNLFISVRNEIKNAEKSTVSLFYDKTIGSYFDKDLNKHVFKAQYKEIFNG